MAHPMNRPMNRWILIALVISSSLLGADDALARKRKPKPVISVANHGLDAAECGHASTPCRSITMGIARAKTLGRGTVSVGPGLYGDLDGNGFSSGFGEEQLPIPVTDIRVVSTHGAARTLIRARNPGPNNVEVVRVENSSGSAFFSGFTIQGTGSIAGISIRRGAAAENLVLTGHTDGAHVVGQGSSLRRSVAVRNSRDGIAVDSGGQVLDTLAIANGGDGFSIFNPGDFRVQGCQAIRNGNVGFLISTFTFSLTQGTFAHNLALANAGVGVLAKRSGRIDLVSNVSSGNGGSGFFLDNFVGGTLGANLTTANRGSGVRIFRSDVSLDRLRAIGNRGDGLDLSAARGAPFVIRRSALFGNNRCQVWSAEYGADVDLERPYLGDSSRCRANFNLPIENTSSSEQEALGVHYKKKGKKKRKKKSRRKGSGATPWPLQP